MDRELQKPVMAPSSSRIGGMKHKGGVSVQSQQGPVFQAASSTPFPESTRVLIQSTSSSLADGCPAASSSTPSGLHTPAAADLDLRPPPATSASLSALPGPLQADAGAGGGVALIVPTGEQGALALPEPPASLSDLGFLLNEAAERIRRVRIRVRLSPSARRLLSGAIAGGVSRTVVAPLETIRTHLMVGSTEQKSVAGVFKWIVETEGWTGLFRGNGINVLRVAPSKAIELYTFDTVKRALQKREEEGKGGFRIPLPFPVSSIAGSCAGIASCTLMYPLELVKTRLTVQKGAYNGIRDAFHKIIRQEGFFELYRGLFASIVGVIPYAGANYFAYDTLCSLYKRAAKKQRIGHFATLLIGSSAGAFAASATFPLEVARKQMQMGALNGRVVYKNTLDCMLGILKEQGPQGLYRGLAPSCIKLVPAAGISFMCYEALKRVLLEEDGLESRQTKGPI